MGNEMMPVTAVTIYAGRSQKKVKKKEKTREGAIKFWTNIYNFMGSIYIYISESEE